METFSHQSQTTGVVIPAYNEAENISLVLSAVCEAEWVREIVVVDDGSSDETFQLAQRFAESDRRVVVIRLPENQGKAAAMLTGVRALQTDLVIFLDADLEGLTPFHLYQLRSQQKSGSHEMAIAVFHIGRALGNYSQRVLPQLSGQRCLWRLESVEALSPLAGDRYGVETGLTLHARRHHWKIRKVVWRGITHRLVWQKRKILGGLYNRWQMYGQIVSVLARSMESLKRRRRLFRFALRDRLTLR